MKSKYLPEYQHSKNIHLLFFCGNNKVARNGLGSEENRDPVVLNFFSFITLPESSIIFFVQENGDNGACFRARVSSVHCKAGTKLCQW